MTDDDISKLASKLNESLATKSDIQEVKSVLKSDIQEVKKELKSDIQEVKSDIQEVKKELKSDIRKLEDKLVGKIDELDAKVDTILTFVDGVDEVTDNHEERLKKIEAVPAIAHQNILSQVNK